MSSFFRTAWTWLKTRTARLGAFAKAHKILTAIIVLVVLGGGYWAYSASHKASGTQYALAAVTQGPLQVTVTGSGQVTAEHQLNLSPKASGTLTSVNVQVGQYVRAGTVIGTVDMQDAANAVQTARQNLASAQITYQQTLTSAHNNTSSDQTAVDTANTTLSTDLTTTYNGLPAIISGFDDALHALSTISGYSAEQSIDAYANYVNTTEAQQYRLQTVSAYDAAVASYQSALAAYTAADLSAATPAQTLQLAQTTLDMTNKLTAALRTTLTYYNYISAQITNGGHTVPSQLTTQISTLSGYLTTVSGDTSTLLSAKTALTNAQNTLAQDTQTLSGSNTLLTLQSAQINLQKAQDAYDQALQAEEDYVIRAPFDGTIASVPLKKYDQASSGTTVATLVTKQNYVDLDLNEADAAKVQVGQKATLTFDAIPNLTVTGTVGEIDQVGAVSQGVVTFTAKIGIDSTDPRIKPGMTSEATILTASKDNAIQVPMSAVHTAGNTSYVEVATLKKAPASTDKNAAARFASTTRAFNGAGQASGTSAPGVTFSRQITVPATDVTIKRVTVTTGISNDTTTEITSGLKPHEFVVTSTLGSSSSSAARTNTGFGASSGSTRRTGGPARANAGFGG